MLKDTLRHHLKTRPLFFTCGVFLLTAFILLQKDSLSPVFAGCATAGLLFFGLLFFSRKTKEVFFCILLPAALAVTVVYLRCTVPYEKSESISENVSKAVFTVTDVDYSTDSASSGTVRISEIDGEKCDITASYRVGYRIEKYTGYRDTVVFSLPNEGDSALSTSYYYRSNGITSVATSLTDYPEETGKVKSVQSFFGEINAFFSDKVREHIGGVPGGLIEALLLGNRDCVDRTVIRDFNNVGLSHVLALSGMHVSIIAMFLGAMLKKLKVNKYVSFSLITVFLAFYALLTGMSGSVLRASLMMILYFAGFLLSRKPDPLTQLIFSVTLIVLAFPHSLLDVGLILSFTSTLGILTLAVPASGKITDKLHKHLFGKVGQRTRKAVVSVISFAVNALLFTLSATAYSLPAVFLFFGKISYFAPVGNLLIAPLASLLIVFSLFFFICLPVPVLAGAVSVLPETVARLMIFLSGKMSASSHLVPLNYPFAPYLVAVFVLALFLMHFFRVGKRLPYFAAVLTFAALFACLAAVSDNISSKDTSFIMLSETEGGAAVTDGGKLYLVMTKSVRYSDRRQLSSIMRGENVCDVEGIVFLYPSDGIAETLKSLSGDLFIKRVYYPESKSRDEAKTVCEERNVGFVSFESGEDIALSPTLTVRTYGLYKNKVFRFDAVTENGVLTYFDGNAVSAESFADTYFTQSIDGDMIYFSNGKDFFKSVKTDGDGAVVRISDGMFSVFGELPDNVFFKETENYSKIVFSGNR